MLDKLIQHITNYKGAEYTKHWLSEQSEETKTLAFDLAVSTCSCCQSLEVVSPTDEEWMCTNCRTTHSTIDNSKSNLSQYLFIQKVEQYIETGITDINKIGRASILPIDFTASLVRGFGLSVTHDFYVVNRLCGNRGGWMPKRQLEENISRRTGVTLNTAKRKLSKLKQLGLICHFGKNIVIISKYRLAEFTGSDTRRCVKIEDIFDYNEFKNIFILAAHRYKEDGYYHNYDAIVAWANSNENLSAAEKMSIPDRRSKVGCATIILQEYLNLSYGTIYNTLKGKVLLQYNYFLYTRDRFKKEFCNKFFWINPRFSYKHTKKGVLISNRISSKSLFSSLFSISKERFSFSSKAYSDHKCLILRALLTKGEWNASMQ